MFFSSSGIIQLLLDYHYLLLFPLVVIEGPFVTILAGFLVSIQELNLFYAYIVIVLADLLGDGLYYSFGRFGRGFFQKYFGTLWGLTDERITTIEDQFHRRGIKVLIIGKVTHVFGGVVLFVAGVVRYPFSKFLWYNFISTLPKSLVLLLLGFYFGAAYGAVKVYLNDIFAVVLVGSLSLFVVLGVTRILKTFLDKKYGELE